MQFFTPRIVTEIRALCNRMISFGYPLSNWDAGKLPRTDMEQFFDFECENMKRLWSTEIVAWSGLKWLDLKHRMEQTSINHISSW